MREVLNKTPAIIIHSNAAMCVCVYEGACVFVYRVIVMSPYNCM